MKTAIYPGTFDPLTFGHLDIIKRSLKIIDQLIIGVADNNNKIPLLTINDRIKIIDAEIEEVQKLIEQTQLKLESEKLDLSKTKIVSPSLSSADCLSA